MRRILGLSCLFLVVALFVLTFIYPHESSSAPRSFMDIVGSISLGLYFVFSFNVFWTMIRDDRISYDPSETFPNGAAIFFLCLTYLVLFLVLPSYESSGPNPVAIDIVLTGIMLGWPIVIIYDWVGKAQGWFDDSFISEVKSVLKDTKKYNDAVESLQEEAKKL